jgi:hypothetical protein
MHMLQQFTARLFESMTALVTLAVLAAAFSGVFGFSTYQSKGGSWSPAPPPSWEEFLYSMEQQATYNSFNRNR